MTDNPALSGLAIHYPHGSYAKGCRCDDCREAAARYMREWRWRTGRAMPREQRWAEVRSRRVHGSLAMYKKAGCRCEICEAWNRGYQAGYRARLRRSGDDELREMYGV